MPVQLQGLPRHRVTVPEGPVVGAGGDFLSAGGVGRGGGRASCPQGASGSRWCRGEVSNDSAGPQLAEVCDADAGELVKKAGLGGADALGRSLGAGAERAAGGHDDHRM